MKILSAEAIRMWDEYTILNEPIASIDLMERAAQKCAEWISTNYPAAPSFTIYCGKGNNGGDGLAIARMLCGLNYAVTVNILEFGHLGTADFQANLARLHQLPSTIHFIQGAEHIHPVPPGSVIIDALYGTGLNREPEGITAALITHINGTGNDVVSIDIPTGLFTDRSSKASHCIKARNTLTFQCYKPAFLFAENAMYTGNVHVLDIGLHPGFHEALDTGMEMTELSLIKAIHKKRPGFAHKGNFGHALLVAGSYGKMGAAVLAANACLRSGVGLLTCHVPICGYTILQTSVPETMVTTGKGEGNIHDLPADPEKYDSIGIGPGLGTDLKTAGTINILFEQYKRPIVLDADALNILSMQTDLLLNIPRGSILTPHPKEFDRLFGDSPDEFQRHELAMKKAATLGCIIILKGHYSLIAIPDGNRFYNSTGNPGMATGGSGDVLTGILTGLLAQGYSSAEAAILGTYIHGLAGDIAAAEDSMESLVAGDLIRALGKAFRCLQ